MKPSPAILPSALALATGVLLVSLPAAAQSAEGFDISDLVPAESAAPAEAPAEAEAAAAEKPPAIGPSRYAGAEIPAYVATLSARLSIRNRQTDPFGRYQDPDFKAPEPKILASKPTQRFKPEPPAPFADVVGALTINLVTAEKQQFLIGNRVFNRGEVFDIALPTGKIVKVQVTGISSRQIQFRNVETGESARLDLGMLPDGMRKGTDGINAPGVEPGGTHAPIQIQPDVPLSNNR